MQDGAQFLDCHQLPPQRCCIASKEARGARGVGIEDIVVELGVLLVINLNLPIAH